MRSLHLIVTLGAAMVRAVPLQPRQFDFDGGGDFSDAGNSINDFDQAGIMEGVGVGDQSFNVADNSFVGVDPNAAIAGVSGESIDMGPTLVASDNLYVDPQPQIVADVPDPGLGAVEGAWIATGPVAPNSGSGLTLSFDNNAPVAAFTPTDSGLIEAMENLNPADIASSAGIGPVAQAAVPVVVPLPAPVVADPPAPVPVTPDPGALPSVRGDEWNGFQPSDGGAAPLDALEPAVPDPSLTDFTGALSIQGFVAPPVPLGADTALTPNPDITENTLTNAFTPGGNVNEVSAALPNLNPPTVNLASAEGGIGAVPIPKTADEFKQLAADHSGDPSLTPEQRTYWQDVANLQLTPEDYGKLSLNEQFTSPSNPTGGTDPTNQQIQAAPVLSPQAQAGFNRLNQIRQSNPGINFNGIITNALNGLVSGGIRLATLNAERNAIGGSQVYTVVQRVGVPVSIPVVYTRVVEVGVPYAVTTTLPGGVVTKIYVYRPKQVVATSTQVSVSSVLRTKLVTSTPVPKVVPTVPKAGGTKRQVVEEEPETKAVDPAESVPVPAQAEEVSTEEVPTTPEEVKYAYVDETPIEIKGDDAHTEKAADHEFKYQPGDYSALEGKNSYPHPHPAGGAEAEEWSDLRRSEIWVEGQ